MAFNDISGKFSCFAAFAGTDLSIWQKIIGSKIKHKVFGVGIVDEVTETKYKDSIHIRVRFVDLPVNSNIKIFSDASFKEGFFENIDINLNLAPGFNDFLELREKEKMEAFIKEETKRKKEQEEQVKQETEFLEKFILLKQEYEIDNMSFNSIASPLYSILDRLEAKEKIDAEDIQWLERNSLFNILAIHYEEEYINFGDLWNLVKASDYWRKRGNPARAIELLKDKQTEDIKLMNAILTTCGEAFKDIHEISEAEKYARDAIKACEGCFNPYVLLGGIYYQKGMPTDGDKYFAKAVELGANHMVVEKEIKNSFTLAEKHEKDLLTKYLLDKNQQKYTWVRNYLK